MTSAHLTKVKTHKVRGAGCTMSVTVYADGTVTLSHMGLSPGGYFDLTHAAQRRLIQILQKCTNGLSEKTFHEVWATAYGHGWSDGQKNRDPNIRRNPYSKDT